MSDSSKPILSGEAYRRDNARDGRERPFGGDHRTDPAAGHLHQHYLLRGGSALDPTLFVDRSEHERLNRQRQRAATERAAIDSLRAAIARGDVPEDTWGRR